MFKLLKNGVCFLKHALEKKDILLVQNKIARIDSAIKTDALWDVETIDCSGKLIFPGLIDQHVHIIGGGGEKGPQSEIPEITFESLAAGGVSTVVGLLGADGVNKPMPTLLSKARKLSEQGLNTYIYSGSYSTPPTTLTGSILTDLLYVEKVIGIGEIALSDYRSSYPSQDLLKQLSHETMLGGLIGKKPGVMHIHIGDGKKGLSPLFELINDTDFPTQMFVPTHINRNKNLFNQGIEFIKMGGHIDLTAGEKSENGYSIPDAVKLILDQNINIESVTISSDGNGSMPGQSNAASVGQLLNDIRTMIIQNKISPEIAFSLATSNVAKLLKMYPRKGAILEGSDADLIILSEQNYSLCRLIVNGKTLFKSEA